MFSSEMQSTLKKGGKQCRISDLQLECITQAGSGSHICKGACMHVGRWQHQKLARFDSSCFTND
jgi:hypothetical protein